MAVRLSELANKLASHEFAFEGDTVKIEFYPHKITPEYRALLQRIGKTEKKDDAVETDGNDAETANLENEEEKDSAVQMLLDLLKGWDVEGLPGEPFPPTFENLQKVPNTLIGATCRAIWEAVGKLTMGETQS